MLVGSVRVLSGAGSVSCCVARVCSSFLLAAAAINLSALRKCVCVLGEGASRKRESLVSVKSLKRVELEKVEGSVCVIPCTIDPQRGVCVL